MERKDPKIEESGDGRPAEVREGPDTQPKDEAEEDIPDPSTVDNVGY
jgi:hypothetical protein